MKAKFFFWTVVVSSAILIGVQISINYYIDLYGLFTDSKGKSITLYTDERTSKYLLAYNYIPRNFDAVWIGPSLSANVNTKMIPQFKIYNLSMMGANITEQRIVAEKVMEKTHLKFAILCLHPYLTMDHGLKTGMINPKEVSGAIGSIGLYKGYTMKFIRENDLLPEKFPSHQFNDFGYNNYNELYGSKNVRARIKDELATMKVQPVAIDSVALQELVDLVNHFTAAGTQVFGYFHPIPFEIMEKNRENFKKYQKTISEAIPKARIIDFNARQYDSFTRDYSNYIDHGHLSFKGQELLIQRVEETFLSGVN